MERRAFVKRLPVLTSGVAAGFSTLSVGGCGGVGYVVPGVHPRGITVLTSLLAERGGLFVQTRTMQRPIFLRPTDDEPVALLAACTHQGCQPEAVGDRLICPCHGSEFSLTGEVLLGPAERALTRFEVTLDGDHWVIHTEGPTS
jgi:Rieske Fe-S protein